MNSCNNISCSASYFPLFLSGGFMPMSFCNFAFQPPIFNFGMNWGDTFNYSGGGSSSSGSKKADSDFSYALKKNIPKNEAKYDKLIAKYAEKYGVDPDFVRAIIKQESAFNPNAVSHCGARGLMQLMPATARGLKVANSMDPEQNINGGVKLIKDLLDRYDGDKQLALAAYNAGPGRVKNRQIPNIKETKHYVKNVMKFYEEYQKMT